MQYFVNETPMWVPNDLTWMEGGQKPLWEVSPHILVDVCMFQCQVQEVVCHFLWGDLMKFVVPQRQAYIWTKAGTPPGLGMECCTASKMCHGQIG